jgi:hypothetical protein
MFTCNPVDVTSQSVFSISIERWHKSCASRITMFYDVLPMMIMRLEFLLLAAIIKFSVFSFRPDLRNHTRDFSLSTDNLLRYS